MRLYSVYGAANDLHCVCFYEVQAKLSHYCPHLENENWFMSLISVCSNNLIDVICSLSVAGDEGHVCVTDTFYFIHFS